MNYIIKRTFGVIMFLLIIVTLGTTHVASSPNYYGFHILTIVSTLLVISIILFVLKYVVNNSTIENNHKLNKISKRQLFVVLMLLSFILVITLININVENLTFIHHITNPVLSIFIIFISVVLCLNALAVNVNMHSEKQVAKRILKTIWRNSAFTFPTRILKK